MVFGLGAGCSGEASESLLLSSSLLRLPLDSSVITSFDSALLASLVSTWLLLAKVWDSFVFSFCSPPSSSSLSRIGGVEDRN